MIKLKNTKWQPIPVDASDVGKDNLQFSPREEKVVANKYAEAKDVKNKVNSGYLRLTELDKKDDEGGSK